MVVGGGGEPRLMVAKTAHPRWRAEEALQGIHSVEVVFDRQLITHADLGIIEKLLEERDQRGLAHVHAG